MITDKIVSNWTNKIFWFSSILMRDWWKVFFTGCWADIIKIFLNDRTFATISSRAHLPKPAHVGPGGFRCDLFAMGRICRNGTNLQRVTKTYEMFYFFTSLAHCCFKIFIKLYFWPYYEKYDVWGTPNLTLKMHSLIKRLLILQNENSCRKISHHFPEANLCPILHRVWAGLIKKKKKKIGSQY